MPRPASAAVAFVAAAVTAAETACVFSVRGMVMSLLHEVPVILQLQ
jgi:hypothetical protein